MLAPWAQLRKLSSSELAVFGRPARIFGLEFPSC